MQIRTISILLVFGLLLASCGGPGHRAEDEWEKACNSKVGTHINRTIKDVDGLIYEGTTHHRTHTSHRRDHSVYRTIPIIFLFDARQKQYAFIEFFVPKVGAHDQSYKPLNLSTGNYRVTREQIDHPNCSKPNSKRRVAVADCLVVSPIPKFTARYKVIHSTAFFSTETGSVKSTNYLVVENKNGNVIAKHSSHSLSWREGGTPFLIVGGKSVSKSCPDTNSVFNIRSVLQPAGAT